MREMYEGGASINEIAERFGYKTGSVGVMLRKAGVSRDRDTAEHIEELVKMRESGMTLQEISNKTGFCVSAICTRLNEAGCRKNVMHDVRPPEPEIDESKLTYATPPKPSNERFIINGVRYRDVTHEVYITPDIMSL